MLILNRKIGESIIINENIEIKILEEIDGRIKIGIDAPKDITILRKEVYEEVKTENIASLEINDQVISLLKNFTK